MSKQEILTIMDISPFIYAGYAYKPNTLRSGAYLDGSQYTQAKIKAGGTAFLFQTLKTLSSTDILIVSDRRPSIKKSMNPSYKCSRERRPEVEQQKRLTELILEDCGFKVLYEEGYESDDFMASCCMKHKSEYREVHLYHGDSDMNMLVDDTVTSMPVSSKGRMVNRQNFETQALSKEVIPFNTVVLNKVIFGDKSDCIDRVLQPATATNLWSAVCRSSMISMGVNKQICEMILKMFTPDTLHESLMQQLELVYPLEVEVSLPDKEPEQEKIAEWGRALDVFGYGRASTSNRVDRKIIEFREELDQMD